MKKFIIAILVFGLLGNFAFAQVAQTDTIINSGVEIDETVLPVRNESNIQAETDISVDANLVDLEVGASSTLTSTISEIIKNSGNFSSTDWCRDASSFIGDLPANAKQSLAWNKNSYNKVVEYVPEDAELAVSYKNAQTAYADLNVAFDDMLGGLIADQAAGRFVAVARSSAIEALAEFKSGDVDQDRLNGLAELSKKSVECASPENSDIVVEKLSALFGTSMPTVDTTSEVEVSYPVTKITQSDVTEETVAVSIDTVVDADTMKAYVVGFMSENERVSSVEDREDSVTVRYETDSKFLGFIKSKTNAKVVVNNDLSVKVNYPFFSFLSSKSFKVNAEEMSSALKDAFAVEENAEVEVSVLKGDFRAKALATTLVANIIKTAQEISVVADTEVEVDTEVDSDVDADVGAAGGTVLEGTEIDPNIDASVQ